LGKGLTYIAACWLLVGQLFDSGTKTSTIPNLLIDFFDDSIKNSTSTQRPRFDAFLLTK
jgi:hypothetical protein